MTILRDKSVGVAGIAGQDVIPLTQTSVPRWTGAPATLPNAATILAMTFGGDASDRMSDLIRDAEVPVTVMHQDSAWEDGFEARLGEVVDAQRVGVRFVIHGPEEDVLRAASLLKELGAIDDELSLFATDVDGDYLVGRGHRRVYCGHCHVIHAVNLAIGDTMICDNCGASLTIHYHYSRPHAAYVGVPNGEDLTI